MEEKTTKADRWIDFLVPWNNAYYFKARRMQTSIKVVILMPLILALLSRAMCIADKFIDETSTLGNLFLWVGIWFAILFIIYLALAHTVLTVAHDSLLEMFLDWSKNRHKNQEVVQVSAVLPVSQESTKKEVEECTKEELEEKEEPKENTVEESSVAEVAEVVTEEEPAGEVVEEVVGEVESEEVIEEVPHVLDLPDPSKLEGYIKENRRRFSKGEDMAMLYDILQEKDVTYANLKDFHTWLERLTNGVQYSAISDARKKLKEKLSEEDEKTINKREAMLNQITEFLI